MHTEVVNAGDKAALDRAVELLRRGDAVALPTETVYGLAADALNPDAVAKIFAAKERPSFNPLIVHLPDKAWLDKVAVVPAADRSLIDRLVSRFWPGPFTLVLPRRDIVPDLVAAGLPTVAVRMSGHPVFDRIVKSLGKPLAAPSANRFGRISPTTGQHVLKELAGRIPLIVDGGPAQKGVESTVVRVTDGRIEILRKGPVTAEELSEIAAVEDASHVRHAIVSPGQTESHYAPSTPLLLVGNASEFKGSGAKVGLLAWHTPDPGCFAEVRQLSPTQDLIEAAARLFSLLRELDAAHLDFIVAESVPETGIGAAIMDRLRRASART